MAIIDQRDTCNSWTTGFRSMEQKKGKHKIKYLVIVECVKHLIYTRGCNWKKSCRLRYVPYNGDQKTIDGIG